MDKILIEFGVPLIAKVKVRERHESCGHWVEIVGQRVRGGGEDTKTTLCVCVCVCVGRGGKGEE